MTSVYVDNCPVCGAATIYVYDYCADYLTSEALFPLCRCHSCGFVFTQEFPPEESIGKYYESKHYASHHDAKGLFGFAYKIVRSIMLRKKTALVKQYATKKGPLLDIGCGQGHFLQKMKTKGFEVSGIEQNEETGKLAREKFAIEVNTPALLKKQKAESFEAITMWHSLEHIEKLNETMSEAHRLLTKTGALIVALPNVSSFDQKHYGFYWAAYDVPRHLWHFSPETFKILAEKHGFEIKTQKAMRFDVFYISILSARNKKSKFATLQGLWFGLRAWRKTLLRPQKASSIIYVLKKR